MQDYIYSVIAIVAIAVHAIINYDMLNGRAVASDRGRRYRAFLLSVLAFYIVDAAWGIFAGLDCRSLLYADTVLYFITLPTAIFFWCRFVISFLKLEDWMAKAFYCLGSTILAFHVIMLIVNFFNGCFFYFNEHGIYTSGSQRYLAFAFQLILDIMTGSIVLANAIRSHGPERSRNITVFVFCITMTVAITIQVIFPLLPFTSLGALMGCCFLHVFLIEDERARLRQAAIEREQTAKHMTELRQALERARTAEKARRTFFSIVSHDIRTPLNAILGYAELLQDDIKTQEEKDEALKSIRASGTTLLQLVNDVLDLAKMDSGKMVLLPSPVNISRLTDEIFSSLRITAAAKGIELIDRTHDVPDVMIDEHRLRQILFNLAGNAVKFTQRGSITVSAKYSGEALEISVADTGCGIPKDMLAHIMDPFVQVQDPSHAADRAGGTGLGLTICRRLVDVMGGEFTIESEEGKGSTFTAFIPGVHSAAAGSVHHIDDSHAAIAKDRLPKHVLVVDDSPVNRAVMTAFLKKTGIESIELACDGEDALSKLEAGANTGEPHDFVLTDFWMPNMNGLELVEKIRADERFAKIPVFAVTADTESRSDKRAKLFDGILLKPLTYSKLLEVL